MTERLTPEREQDIRLQVRRNYDAKRLGGIHYDAIQDRIDLLAEIDALRAERDAYKAALEQAERALARDERS